MTRALWVIVGVGAVVLAALPISRWVGAPDPGPDFAIHVRAWGMGLVLVVVGALLLGRVAVHVRTKLPGSCLRYSAIMVAVLAVCVTLGSAFVMQWAFAANPHSVDEMAQLFQARVFLAGRLAAPVPQPPEAFLFMNTWITPAGWVAQFPPGHAVLLAAGMAGGLEWLVNPVLGGIAVVLVYRLTLGLYGKRTALLAALLWAASAWVLTMSGTYMNHAAAVVFALGAWTLALGPRGKHGVPFVAAGLCLGALAATRPLDAAAAALPVAAWLLTRRRWKNLAAVVVGGLPVVVLLGYFNWRVFGHPLEFGYGALYGDQQRLGFHTDVWGRAFTPLIGLSNLAAAVRRLHIYLFEWPIPALLPLAIWGVCARHRHPGDLPLVVGIVGLPLLYFFYWHSGFYPGPRFYYLIAPLLVIGTARAFWWGVHRARRHASRFIRWDAAVVGGGVLVLLVGAVALVPARMVAYRSNLARSLKYHPERELARKGVHQALVLVPESWGARIVVDLWAWGVRPGLVERAYRGIDACELYLLADRARRDRWSPERLGARLEEIMAAAGEPAPLVRDWPDPTLRVRHPDALTAGCRAELRRDLAGFALYGNLAWRNQVGLSSGIVFARDLFEHNDRLLTRYPGWQVWRLAPPAGEPDAPPVLTQVRRGARDGIDSLGSSVKSTPGDGATAGP